MGDDRGDHGAEAGAEIAADAELRRGGGDEPLLLDQLAQVVVEVARAVGVMDDARDAGSGASRSEWPRIRAEYERWLDPSNFDGNGKQQTKLTT